MTTPEFHPPEERSGAAGRRRIDEESARAMRAPTPGDRASGRARRNSRAVTPQLGGAVSEDDPFGFPLAAPELERCVRAALEEDGAYRDVATAACVLSARRAHGTIVARGAGVIAGVPLAVAAFRLLDANMAIRVDADDGAPVLDGTIIMRITGLAHAILSAERVALNYLRELSGIATLTSHYADAVRGTGTGVRETWRVTPGLRALQHYAVRAGGGMDERGAQQRVLVRGNHVSAVGGDIEAVVRRARELAEHAALAVECRSVGQVREALDCGVDAVVLDGLTAAQVRECVEAAAGRARVDVTGTVRLDTVRAFAQAGADHVAVDALTECAPALDLALAFEPA